jgi:hypothetical protein
MEPTNGRIVWYTPAVGDGQIVYHGKPLAAIVCNVWGDRMVNLSVIDANGVHHARTSVVLLQGDDPKPSYGNCAEWMPYQKVQHNKSLEASKLKDLKALGQPFREPFTTDPTV